MFLMPPSGFEWPFPWVPIRDENEALQLPRMLSEEFGDDPPEPFLVDELRREVCPEHPLHGRSCLAVAQAKDDPNEFVFLTDNPAFPIAFVHLTWAVEKSPTFPYTLGYPSWDEFKRAWTSNSG
ncbi:MAG TPA: hypothetical protein VEL76_28150 [Gemmataceae bacterium]|nr:hypothetical protein [Gemmataceae bacterium]